MRRKILVWSACLLALLLASMSMFAQQKSKPHAILRVEPKNMELGDIELSKLSDDMGKVTFKVHNDGNAPLLLQSVQGCCGTDIKDYTKGPILPGKMGEIKVEFRIEPRLQAILRTVTIRSNDPEKPEVKSLIRGAVVKDKEKGRLMI